MSQKDERNKAIDKVRKLRDRMAGAGSSENEIETSMKVMGNLMDTFAITMDEVSLAAEECKLVKLDHYEGNTFRLGTVSVAIANFCDCVTYYNAKPKTQKVDKAGKRVFDKQTGRPHYEKAGFTNNFFGIESDAETAAYLMEMVRASALKAVAEFKKSATYKEAGGSKTTLTKSFVDGFAHRIVRRLDDLKDQREEEVIRAREARAEMGEDQTILNAEVAVHERRAGRSTDLVALKDKKVKDDFREKFGWSVKYRSSRSSGGSWSGRSAGASAADNVNLSRPIGNGGGYSGQRQLAYG